MIQIIPFLRTISRFIQSIKITYYQPLLSGKINKGEYSYVTPPSYISDLSHIEIGNYCNIERDSIILNVQGSFIMKDHSGAATGLKVVTDNHNPEVGEQYSDRKNGNLIKGDVLVDEDVWIGLNVTLLANRHICRGAIVGAGTVVRGQKIPPYALVVGNPAKIVGFRFTPEEIIEHEKALYPEEDRLPLGLLEKNYNKYFINRISEIKSLTKL